MYSSANESFVVGIEQRLSDLESILSSRMGAAQKTINVVQKTVEKRYTPLFILLAVCLVIVLFLW